MAKIIKKLPLDKDGVEFWTKLLNDPKHTTLAFHVLVNGAVETLELEKLLSSIYYVQITQEWEVDAIALAEYVEDKRGEKFVERFVKYLSSTRPYLINEMKSNLQSQEYTKKWAKYLKH